MKRAILVMAAAMAAPTAWAQAVTPETRVALVTEHSHLDQGLASWRQHSLLVSRHWDARTVLMAEAHGTERFGRTDHEYAIGGSLPLTPALTLGLRAATSPSHRVIARGSAGGTLQYEFAKGWLVHGGLRHTRYDATDVDQGSLMLERYFDDFSVLGAVHRTRAFGQHHESHELRGSWYYADKSSIGLFLASGDEVAQVGAGALAVSRVRSVALVGKHHPGGSWTVHYGLHRIEQGTAYTRSGFTLGAQYAF